MTSRTRSPAELRNMFGQNLRRLAKRFPSISELARQLGINRTQLNRYLSGESFPRPDVLDRICSFFGVDARILLEPVETLEETSHILSGPFLRDFVGRGSVNIPQDIFPDGFYRFARRSFLDETLFLLGLVYVFRERENTYIRGYEAKEGMRQQGLPESARTREFRGYVARQDDGITLVVSRRNSMTCSFNYLASMPAFENNFWVGYVTRTMREAPTGIRAARLVYEHLGSDPAKVWPAARDQGFRPEEYLSPFYRKLLQGNTSFR